MTDGVHSAPKGRFIPGIAGGDVEGPYMGGRGLRARTRELNDASWAAVGPAFISVSIFICVATLIAGAVGLGLHWSALALIAPPAWFAVKYFVVWNRAIEAVKTHSQKMRAETAKRGHGWARD